MTMPDLDEQPNLEGLPGLVKLWQDGGRDDAPGELRQKITALIVPSPPSGQEDRLAAALDRADPHDPDLVDTLRAALAALPFTDELTTLPTNPATRDWLVKGLIPHGRLAALYGAGAVGKSRLVLQLAAAVITGTGPIIACDPAAIRDDEVAAIGDVPTVQQQGRVLLVTWEDEPDEIARRWQLAGHALPNPENPGDALAVLNMRTLGGSLWAPHAGGSRHTSTAGEWTASGHRLLKTLPDFTLAVIDPLAAAYANSEIDRALVRAFTSALDAAAEACGCAVLLVGHPPKSDASYSGSTDWRNAVRALLTLEPKPTGYRRTGHGVRTSNETKKPPLIEAPCLVSDKCNYGPAVDRVWLRSEWTPANNDGTPARLAWWATTAKRAAAAKAGIDLESLTSDNETNAGEPGWIAK